LPSPTGCGEPWRFSSEMGTATREENASKQEARAVGSDSIRTGQCSGSAPADDRRSPVQWNEGRHRSWPPIAARHGKAAIFKPGSTNRSPSPCLALFRIQKPAGIRSPRWRAPLRHAGSRGSRAASAARD
jgi:hypothetical protein